MVDRLVGNISKYGGDPLGDAVQCRKNGFNLLLGDQCRRLEGGGFCVRAVRCRGIGQFHLICQRSTIQVKKFLSRQCQGFLCPCAAHSFCPTEPAPVTWLLLSFSLKCHLCHRPDALSPIQKFLFRTGKRTDILKPRLDDSHGNSLDVKQIVIGIQCAKCIQHHLCVVVCINEHAGTRLEITDMEQTGSQDHHIPGTKTARCYMAVIQFFFHQCQHRKSLCLQLLNRGDHKLRINVCDIFNLLGQIL